MKKLKKKRERKRSEVHSGRHLFISIVPFALIVVIAICLLVNAWLEEQKSEEIGDENSNSENVQEEVLNKDDYEEKELILEYESPIPEIFSFTVSLAGDCTLGTDESYGLSGSFVSEYELQYPSYFFENVYDIFSADDLTIVNLEGPLTDSTNKADKTFAFKGEPEFTEILTTGSVEAVDVANNHSYDYGTEGFDDTAQALLDAGVTGFGYDETPVLEINGVKVGLVGVYMLRLSDEEGKEAISSRIAQAKEMGAEVILVAFHWGIESDYTPTSSQEMLAKYAIDEGADLVYGHHPHVLQGIEEYKGKYIVYSLGNFCFGGNRNPSDKDTIIFQQTFTVQNGEILIDDNINIIPCSISSVSTRNDFQPTPLEGDEKDRVVEKLQNISMMDITSYISE